MRKILNTLNTSANFEPVINLVDPRLTLEDKSSQFDLLGLILDQINLVAYA